MESSPCEANLELLSASARSHLSNGFVPRLPIGFAEEEDLKTVKSLFHVMVLCTTFHSSHTSTSTSAARRLDLSIARHDSHLYLEAAAGAQR